TYTYDNLGRATAIARAGGSAAATSASYDGADRLSSFTQSFAATVNNVTWGFGYSPGNQTISRTATNDAYSYHLGTGSKTYGANGLNQYATVAGTSFSYDGRGNLTSDGARSFTFDLENHLLTASAPTAVSLAYDPAGRLQASTVGGATTSFLYDGDRLVGEYAASGAILARYVFGPGVDGPLVWYSGAGTSSRNWLHADNQNSVVAWSDSSGNLTASKGYDPYGQPSAWTGARFAYTGQMMIPEAQLYHYKARVYDPGLGRFLQTDPVGYASDLNAYAYAGEDPIDGRDPSGLEYPQTPILNCEHSKGPCPSGPGTTASGTFSTTLDVMGPGAPPLSPLILVNNVLGSGLGNVILREPTGGQAQGPGNNPPQNQQGCNTTNTNSSVQDRGNFFSHMSELTNVAQALNVPVDYIVGLSSYESGWLDAHNVGLHNLWGLTQAGGNNINFSSFAAGNAYFINRVGSYIRNANTLAAFDQGLMNEGYN
ncbi:MAG: RHS repeat-associated core domain-containing protein, partial [Gammaproteobacteria bacterium]